MFPLRSRNNRWIKPVSVGAAMADMALLLIIFFMTTTSAQPPRAIEITPPEGLVEPAQNQIIKITISKNKEFFYNDQPVTSDQIGEIMGRSGLSRNTPVSINADRNLDYSVIASLIEVLQNREFLNVTFLAEEKTGKDR